MSDRHIKYIDGIRPPMSTLDLHYVNWLSQVPWSGTDGNMFELLVVDKFNPSQSYIIWDQK